LFVNAALRSLQAGQSVVHCALYSAQHNTLQRPWYMAFCTTLGVIKRWRIAATFFFLPFSTVWNSTTASDVIVYTNIQSLEKNSASKMCRRIQCRCCGKASWVGMCHTVCRYCRIVIILRSLWQPSLSLSDDALREVHVRAIAINKLNYAFTAWYGDLLL